MEEQYKTINKYDRAVGGLQGANNLQAKPTTIQHVEYLTGEAETFIIQTIRAEYKVKVQKGLVKTEETRVGNFIILNFVDKDGTKRLILPPKVSETIDRQGETLRKKDDARKKKNRSEQMRELMRERMANGFVPNFQKTSSAV